MELEVSAHRRDLAQERADVEAQAVEVDRLQRAAGGQLKQDLQDAEARVKEAKAAMDAALAGRGNFILFPFSLLLCDGFMRSSRHVC